MAMAFNKVGWYFECLLLGSIPNRSPSTGRGKTLITLALKFSALNFVQSTETLSRLPNTITKAQSET